MSDLKHKLPPVPPDEIVVTRQQLRDIIKAEHLYPGDLFDEAVLVEWAEDRAARQEAVKRLTAEEAAKPEEGAAEKPDDAASEKYFDPKQNPFIKVEPDPADADGGEPEIVDGRMPLVKTK